MSQYRLLHTMLRVFDLDKSLDFYTRLLGMTLLRKTDFEGGRFTLAFVGYGEEAEGAAIAQQVDAGKLSQRRHGQRQDQEAQRPEAERLLELAHRIGAETAGRPQPEIDGGRQQADDVDAPADETVGDAGRPPGHQ